MSNIPSSNPTKTTKATTPTNKSISSIPFIKSKTPTPMNDKLYYTIGEVSQMLGVNPSLLRFWETAIPAIQPRKNSKGTRYYTADDIALLKHIYHLTRDCGYTLDGVNEQLRHKENLDENMQLVQTLTDAKQFLLELKSQL